MSVRSTKRPPMRSASTSPKSSPACEPIAQDQSFAQDQPFAENQTLAQDESFAQDESLAQDQAFAEQQSFAQDQSAAADEPARQRGVRYEHAGLAGVRARAGE